jgi:hypothetical protein
VGWTDPEGRRPFLGALLLVADGWFTLPEGVRHFVATMPAPVASRWSGCRVGLAPTGKRRLVTAHTLSGHSLYFAGRSATSTSIFLAA